MFEVSKNNRNWIKDFFNDDFFKFGADSFETDIIYTTNEDGQKVAQIEVPGFNKNNLKVEISEGVLTVSGKTDTRKVFKQYTLGNVDNVTASIKDGILSLTLFEPEKETTKVQITS